MSKLINKNAHFITMKPWHTIQVWEVKAPRKIFGPTKNEVSQ